MQAYWSNEIEAIHGEKLILSKAKSILSRTGNNLISTNAEFESALLISVNKAAQMGLFNRLKLFAKESQYEDLKEDIALEPVFFDNEYYAKLQAGLPESQIDPAGVVISSNVALLGELIADVISSNTSNAWNDDFIAKLLDDIEFELAEETLARKHL